MCTLAFGIVSAALAFSGATNAQPGPAGPATLAGRVVTGTGADAKLVHRARVTLTGRGQRCATP